LPSSRSSLASESAKSAYTAKRNERIAVIACGYADGYPRQAPSGTPVLVDGYAPIAGRVSMDKITVDVTDVPLARVGSQVQLWGDRLAVDEVANAAGTIGYELLTAIAARCRDGLFDAAQARVRAAIQDCQRPLQSMRLSGAL
jgi:alanine racemase